MSTGLSITTDRRTRYHFCHQLFVFYTVYLRLIPLPFFSFQSIDRKCNGDQGMFDSKMTEGYNAIW